MKKYLIITLSYILLFFNTNSFSNDIKKNVRIVVIDSSYEFGNNKLLPAGPLRQTIKSSFDRFENLASRNAW